jgi:hypothetical protein
LSFDKIRAVTKVATSDDDEMWTLIALHASGAQLARICRGCQAGARCGRSSPCGRCASESRGPDLVARRRNAPTDGRAASRGWRHRHGRD